MAVHCDDLIEDQTQPECLRRFLHYNRLPAVCKLAGISDADLPKVTEYIAEEHRPYIWTDPAPTLFATLKADHIGHNYEGHWENGQPVMSDVPLRAGQYVRVVMASRFGDVGITNDLDVEHGYVLRVPVEALDKFSAEKPNA